MVARRENVLQLSLRLDPKEAERKNVTKTQAKSLLKTRTSLINTNSLT